MDLKYKVQSEYGHKGHRSSKDAETAYGEKPTSELTSSVMLALLIGVPLAVLLFMGTRFWVRQKLDGDPPPIVKVHEPTAEAAPVAWRGLQPEQIAAKFLAATTQQERLRWVREPAAVAAIMERFYRDGPGAAEKVAGIGKMPQVMTEDQVCARFTVRMTDGSKRLLCVPFDESGAGVDFKSYARYGSEPWSAVLDGTVAKADEMRVFLEPGDYYNHEFADESQWLCLIATSPELENPIYLYARRDNPDLLRFLKNPPTEPQRYVIAIENPGEGHRTRQWQLKRVIATGWVQP
jgi:hypothetical protein